ncbi:hypothetical protein [Carnimonas bestiolae]|uniref:hypothetical protein n=1 Tax=Carnimonas bestiolae TaxID=3402172 RepID=UPI003EDC7EC7
MGKRIILLLSTFVAIFSLNACERNDSSSSTYQAQSPASPLGKKCSETNIDSKYLDEITSTFTQFIESNSSYNEKIKDEIQKKSVLSIIDDEKSALIYITENVYCGTGGCTMLVLRKHNDGNFKIINKMTVVKPPIYSLKEKHNGHQSFAVNAKTNSESETSIVKIDYDGSRYVPNNPSMGKNLIDKQSDIIDKKIIDFRPSTQYQCNF